MTIFDVFREDVECFKEQRAYLMASASLPPKDTAMSFGDPPFVVDDGTDCFCILQADGTTLPLPYGYVLPAENIATDGEYSIFTWPSVQPRGGVRIARLVPLVSDFSLPAEEYFEIEDLEDIKAWGAIDKVVDALQDAILAPAKSRFAKMFFVTALRLYRQFEKIDSVELATAIVLSESDITRSLFLDAVEQSIEELKELVDGNGES